MERDLYIPSVRQATENVLTSDDRIAALGISDCRLHWEPRLPNRRGHCDLLWTMQRDGNETALYVELVLENETLTSEKVHALTEAVRSGRRGDVVALLLHAPPLPLELEKYCASNGISHFELTPPTPEDWAGRIREIRIQMHVVSPSFSNLRLELDEDHAKRRLEEAGKDQFRYEFSGRSDQLEFTDESGEPVATVHDILNQADGLGMDVKDGDSVQMTHEFDPPAFISTDIGALRVKGLHFTCTWHVHENPIVVDASKNLGFAIGFSLVRFVRSYFASGKIGK